MTRSLLSLLALSAATFALAADPPKLLIQANKVTTVTVNETVVVDGKPVAKAVEVPVSTAVSVELVPKTTAVVVCDMWDNHWCVSAAKRCDGLAKAAAPVIDGCRAAGMTIIHCPSDCMDFYKDGAARKRAKETAKADPPKAKALPDPKLPIDDSDGGCDDATPVKSFKAWTRQHEAISVDDDTDYVTDQGGEVFNILKDRGLTRVIVLGVHTNMCVLNRGFAIKQLRKWDVDCLLVRDLTDAMYNPAKEPKVSHDEGTQLVIRHIEQHWCPSISSSSLPTTKKK